MKIFLHTHLWLRHEKYYGNIVQLHTHRHTNICNLFQSYSLHAMFICIQSQLMCHIFIRQFFPSIFRSLVNYSLLYSNSFSTERKCKSKSDLKKERVRKRGGILLILAKRKQQQHIKQQQIYIKGIAENRKPKINCIYMWRKCDGERVKTHEEKHDTPSYSTLTLLI